MSIFTKIFGTKNDKIIKKEIMPIVNKINSLEESMQALTDEAYRQKLMNLKNE